MSDDQFAWSRAGGQVIFAMDRYGVCTMSVGPGLRAIGFADGELVGRSLLDVYRDDPDTLASLHRALAGDSFTATRERSGRTVWVHYEALLDADGLYTGSVGVSTDVTDQLVAARRAAAAEERSRALEGLTRELSRPGLTPDEVLDVGCRVATATLAEAGVAWVLPRVERPDAPGGPEPGVVRPSAVWHTDPDLRARLRAGLEESVDEPSAWRDAERLQALEEPVVFDRSDVGSRPHGSGSASRIVDDLGLVHGLRVPLRSRGRAVGAVDFVRGRDRGPYDADDLAFAVQVADRFAVAHDNALLLAEQREGLRTLAKFRALADSSDDLILIADDSGRPTYVNPRLRDLGLGLAEDDIWTSVATYFGADRSREMHDTVRAGGRWQGPVHLPGDDPDIGMVAYAEVFPLVIDETGEPGGVAWIAQDVTALRATERRLLAANAELSRFQSLVEASGDFIAIAGFDGVVSYLNPAGRAMVGLPPDADVTETTIADYLTPEGLEASVNVEQPAVREHGHWEGESTLRRFDGGPPIPVAIASFLMRDLETGEPIGLATVQHDITERQAAASAVRQLSEHRRALLVRLVEAQEAERAKIAADVHDDSVQAIAAVDLRLGLLRRRVEEQAPQLVELLGPVQQSVARANERLRGLLFDLEAPDVADGLASALRRAAGDIFAGAEVEVAVEADDEPAAGPQLRTVAYRIAREALINARRHAGAAHVWVRVGRRDDDLLVEIADDGSGLGPEPPRSAPGHHGVTGMRDRASVAGGSVTFGDRPGGGALVSLRLPLDTPSA